jgi:biotin operon repressor
MEKPRWSLRKTEVQLLRLLQGKKLTLAELASELSKSLSTVSEAVKHLEMLGMVEKEKHGPNVMVTLPKTPLGESLSLLIAEQPMLNLETLFSGSGLVILPLLLKPGYSAKDLAERTTLSLRTAKGLLPRWKRMGVVLQEQSNYQLNPRFKLLANFLGKFNEHKNLCTMKENYPEGVIVWQWRDEFLFSIDAKLNDPNALPAGLTRLDELKSGLAHSQQYYYCGHADKEISKEEAFMQALYVDPYNPRIKNLISEHLRSFDSEAFFSYAGKYAKKNAIKDLVRK